VTAKKSARSPKKSGHITALLLLLVDLCFGLVLLLLFAGRDLIGLFKDTRLQGTPYVPITALPPMLQTALPPMIQTPLPAPQLPGQPTSLAPARTPPEPEAAPASSNSWWQVFFTDPTRTNDPNRLAGSVEEQLITYISQAQRTIHIAAFEFSLTPVARALIAAKQRGVEVRWVTDDENGLGADNKTGRGQFKMLKSAGIPVRADHRAGLMHNKFIIFDDQTVWTGSMNMTVNDVFHNNNNVIVIQSQALAEIYEAQFNDLWNGRFDSNAPSNVDQQALTIRSTPIQVLFSPEDDTIPYLVSLVESAQTSIRFMAFSFTHDDLTKAILDRAKAGVDVAGIFETLGSETEFSALPPLYCAGLQVRQDGNKENFHHKVIIVDGKIVVTGSLNFSNNANQDNNENTLILQNARIAQKYLQEFSRRWAEATPPKPGDMNCP
jgi:phosphatidylserine/phosphatidylglycerophosphate/cardiolipin synthase-like enzyme